MRKTAIDYLISQMLECSGNREDDTLHIIIPRDALEKAKEMEKQQIIDAYLKNHLQGCWMEKSAEEFAEEYYNEKFKIKYI